MLLVEKVRRGMYPQKHSKRGIQETVDGIFLHLTILFIAVKCFSKERIQ